MSKKTLVTILGGTVIVLPFLGFPSSVTTPIYVLVGMGIIYIARAGGKKKVHVETKTQV
jgi:hypothetical protein